MPASAKLLLVASVLFLGQGHAEEPSSPEAKDPLEAARRDLKALPGVERGVSPRASMEELAIPLPSFHAPASPPSAGAASEAQGFESTSQGWLLDALTDTGRRTARDGKNGLDSSARTFDFERQKRSGATNPLERYLQQWLSPQSRGILANANQGQVFPVERRPGTPSNWQQARPNDRPGDGFRLGEDPLNANRRANPYLVEPTPEDVFVIESSKPLSDASSPKSQQNAPLATQMAAPLAGRDSTPDFPSLKPRRDTISPVPPPTAPLIDEHKYFPQLRRF